MTFLNIFYVKVITTKGLWYQDISVDEILLSKDSILKYLDQDSLCFIYYLAGKLEDLANNYNFLTKKR